jgi:hypothetical protein
MPNLALLDHTDQFEARNCFQLKLQSAGTQQQPAVVSELLSFQNLPGRFLTESKIFRPETR